MAMIIGIEDYVDMEDLIDTLHEETDPAYQRELKAAREEYESGEVGTERDLWDSLDRNSIFGETPKKDLQRLSVGCVSALTSKLPLMISIHS